MDFIPFSDAVSKRNKTSSPHSFKNISQKGSQATTMKKSLSFGSPAVTLPAFGSPAVNFGAPAYQNPGFNRQNSSPSPRHFNPRHSPGAHVHNTNPFHQQSPRGHSPRQYSPYGNNSQYSPYGNNKQSNNSYSLTREGSSFKTPHQFSPNRGRGNGRKSFNRQFGQVIILSLRVYLEIVLYNNQHTVNLDANTTILNLQNLNCYRNYGIVLKSFKEVNFILLLLYISLH